MNPVILNINRLLQRLSPTMPCPPIHWQNVVRVEAWGTDAVGAFSVWITFTHADGSAAEVSIDTKGFWDIVESLHTRIPSIPPNWYDEMAEESWYVERLLYIRDEFQR